MKTIIIMAAISSTCPKALLLRAKTASSGGYSGSANGSSSSGGKSEQSCCRCAASAFLSVSTGIAAVKSLFADAETAQVVETLNTIAPPAPHPLAAAHQELKCHADKTYMQAVTCPFQNPLGWAMVMRGNGTRAVCRTRAWARSAFDDPSSSLGVIAAAGGTVSAAPAMFTMVSPQVLWLAGVSLFTVGALDKFINLQVNSRLKAVRRAEANAAAAAASSSLSPMAGFDGILSAAPAAAFSAVAASRAQAAMEWAAAHRQQIMSAATFGGAFAAPAAMAARWAAAGSTAATSSYGSAPFATTTVRGWYQAVDRARKTAVATPV